MASTNRLKNIRDPIYAWTTGFHENFRRAYTGNLPKYLKNIREPNKGRVKKITKFEKEFRTKFKMSNSLPNYLYRGMHTGPNKINNKMIYSSWTRNLNTAKRFGSPMSSFAPYNKGSVVRINTKILKNIPVLNISNTTGEYEVILPPLKFGLNRSARNTVANRVFIVPVTNVKLNSLFSTIPNKKKSLFSFFRRKKGSGK